MNTPLFRPSHVIRQSGLSMIEMMVAIAISLVVLSGVVNVLVVSKSNFVSLREMSSLQENARFALKYMTDEIRMAGFVGCTRPTSFANVVRGSTTSATSWYLGPPGLQGYDYDATVTTFPTEFQSSVRANTDAIAIRRGEATGLRVTNEATPPTINVNVAHSYRPGQVMLVVTPDCDNVGMFQISSPTNATGTATTMLHSTGTASPGNGSARLKGACTYNAAGTILTGATPANTGYMANSNLLALHSEAYYVGNSESDSTVPALFRERMTVNTSTSTPYTLEEELVQGIENMQILYGIDSNVDGNADAYAKAHNVTTWANVVSVRITLRMRSVNPVYANSESYSTFEGVSGTSGSDRYMRQTVSSTIMIRNYQKLD